MGGLERERAVHPSVIHLRKRYASCIACRAYQCGRHFIRDIECLNQDRLVSFQANGVFHQEFCEFIESLVVHRRLSFHQPDTMQLQRARGEKRRHSTYCHVRHASLKERRLQTSFAANAPSKPLRKGSESFCAFKPRAGSSARSRRTTFSFSSGSRLHVL